MGEADRRSFILLIVASFVVQTGFGAILPMLPLFIRQHGFPLAWMGGLAGAYAATSFVGQMVLGPLADRMGRRRLMVVGVLIQTLGTAGFLLHLSPGWYVVFRMLQGVGAAALIPAANAMVADVATAARRGRAYGYMGSASMAGFAVGPMLGGVMGTLFGLKSLFAFSSLLYLCVALVLWLSLPPTPPARHTSQDKSHPRHLLSILWPYFAMNFGWMGIGGMYDTVWSLYMRWLGASDWIVSLSFTLFALPMLIVNFWGGRWADRRHWRVRMIILGTGIQIVTVVAYVVTRSGWLAIVLSMIEASAMSLTGPSLSAAVMEHTPAYVRGAVQGWFQASGTLGAMLLALASGPLLTIRPNLPFVLGALVLIIAVVIFALGVRRIPDGLRVPVADR